MAFATSSADINPIGDSSGKARARIGVSVRSGLTTFARTPAAAHSSARPSTRLTTPALLAE